jgi:hypothetical protein
MRRLPEGAEQVHEHEGLGSLTATVMRGGVLAHEGLQHLQFC